VFNVNDIILYGTHGVCKIDKIIDKDCNGESMKYYVLRPLSNEDLTVFVPVYNDALTDKMHNILSVDEIYALIKTMPDENCIWLDNENMRKDQYRQILASGNRTELIKIIKTLYLQQQILQEKGRKLHNADEQFFKAAENLLYDEFALVLNIKKEEVLPFILEQIQVEEKK